MWNKYFTYMSGAVLLISRWTIVCVVSIRGLSGSEDELTMNESVPEPW